MNITWLKLEGAAAITPSCGTDDRGEYSRIYCSHDFQPLLNKRPIININKIFTKHAGTIRGLHFQHGPHAESKIIACITGKIYDVMIDLRKSSPTYGTWHAQIIDSKGEMLFAPAGFAHGYQTLEHDTTVIYYVDTAYAPDFEGGILYSDQRLNIPWPHEVTCVSHKDKYLPPFSDDTLCALD